MCDSSHASITSEPELLAPAGPDAGRSWLYRGYPIHSNRAETLFTLGAYPPGLPGNWSNVGRVLIVQVLDAWLDEGRLPAPYTLPVATQPSSAT